MKVIIQDDRFGYNFKFKLPCRPIVGDSIMIYDKEIECLDVYDIYHCSFISKEAKEYYINMLTFDRGNNYLTFNVKHIYLEIVEGMDKKRRCLALGSFEEYKNDYR